MDTRVFRSILEPLRDGLSTEQKWKSSDKGLITCWEVGRKLSESDPELAEKAKNGELPVLGWKGGIETKLKTKTKYGTLYYLAQWQGLRGEDLHMDLKGEVTLTCTRTGQTIVYTADAEKWKGP